MQSILRIFIIIELILHMQTLLEGRKISEEEEKEVILELLADKYCRTILRNIIPTSKSAMEISAETRIPISTVYRRLQSLHNNKLLSISGRISDDGKKYFLYKSRIKAIFTSFNGNFVQVEVVPNTTSSRL